MRDPEMSPCQRCSGLGMDSGNPETTRVDTDD